jgi:hypothetical protein
MEKHLSPYYTPVPHRSCATNSLLNFCHHFQGIVFDCLLYVHTLFVITIKVEGVFVEKLIEEHFLNVQLLFCPYVLACDIYGFTHKDTYGIDVPTCSL